MIRLPRHSQLLILALAVFFGSAAPVISAAKLAVWGTADQQDATACLVAELSRNPDAYTVLEREQLDRLAAESTLQGQGFTLARATEAARLLGADGVLWAESGNFKGRPVVITRLCAVASAVVVGWQIDDGPLPDPVGWAKLTASRVGAWRAKLGIPRDRAVPISLVDIRSATESATANDSGQTLRSLLGARLTAQPELFLLERWRMEELGWESVLAGDAFPAFWNGAWLLDGSVTEAAGKVELSMRLRAADGKEIRWVRQGRDTDLKQLVTDLTADVLERVPRGGTPAAWDSEAEAREFFAEAEWAARWDLDARALESSEAAIALGLDSVPAQRLRYLSSSRLAAKAVGRFSNLLYPAGRTMLPTRMPDERSIDRGIRALELFNELRNSHAGNGLSPNPPMEGVPIPALQDSVELLGNAFCILWSAYWADPDRTAEVASKLARLRGAARALFDREFAGIEKDLSPHLPDRLPSFVRPGYRGYVEVDSLPLVGMVYGSLWAERSTDHEVLVKKLLGNHSRSQKLFFDEIYQTISSGRGGWAVDWETRDKRLAVANWERFFRGLLKEEPLCLRVAASLWLVSPRTKFVESGRLPVHKELPAEFFAPLVDQWDAVINGRLPVDYLIDMIDQALGNMSRACRDKLVADLAEMLARPGEISPLLARFINALPLYPAHVECLGAVVRKKIADSGPEVLGNGGTQEGVLACLKKLGVQIEPLPPERASPILLKPMVRQGRVNAMAAWLELSRNGIRWVTLIEGHLWVVAAPASGDPYQAPPCYTLGRISLPDCKVEEVISWQDDQPGALASSSDFPGFALLAGSVYSWEGQTLCRRKIEGGEREIIPLPITQRPRMWAVNGQLYLGLSSGGVLRVNPETKDWELLADSKRRPAQGILDDCPPYPVEHIWQDSRRSLCVSMGRIYSFDETRQQWNSHRGNGYDFYRHPFDRALALENLYDNANADHANLGRTISVTMLLGDIDRKGALQDINVGTYFGGLPALKNGLDQWWPIGSMVEKSDLWALFREGTQPNNANHLVWMPALPRETVAIKIKFPQDALAKISSSPDEGAKIQGAFGASDDVKMIFSPHGLAIYQVGYPALWFILREELEAVGVSFSGAR